MSRLTGTYIRPAPTELVGETALLREHDGKFLAQFDNLAAFSRHETDWAYGWHEFSQDSFDVHDDQEDI